MEENRADKTESPKKTSPAVLAVCALVLLFAAGIRIKDALDTRTPVTAEASMRGRVFSIEIADNPAKREKGLGGREELAADHGMYFPFTTAGRWVFWMKDMNFPIDIIWIREGKVVDIHHSIQPPKSLPLDTFSPIEPADAVLEVNAGISMEIGLEIGDEVVLSLPQDGA